MNINESNTRPAVEAAPRFLPQGNLGQRLGIVDLGSNTARLVVFRYQPGHWFRLEDSIRETIRLAEGMGSRQELAPAARQRAHAALKLFSDFAHATALEDVDVIATSAVRDASNREEFFREIEDIDLPVTILSGEEEATYGVRAVANGLALEHAWVIDLGGGSMQISRMTNRLPAGGTAYPLGALRLTERFLDGAVEAPRRGQIKALEDAVAGYLEPHFTDIHEADHELVAMGGTIRTLARLAQRLHNHPIALLHGYRLSLDNLEAVVDSLAGRSLADRRKMGGLNPDRADIIVAGALAFRCLLRKTERQFITISGFGVREGALFGRMLAAPHLVGDVKEFGVENLFQHHAQPRDHTERVIRLSLQLFDQLERIHRLGVEYRTVLAAAAKLHDIGMTIDYNRHHHHGQMLLHSAPLPGFSHREQALIALLVRYHRKSDPSPMPYSSILSAADRRALPILVICLRLAEQFERSRTGRVRDVKVAIESEEIRLTLVCPEEPSVEIWEGNKHQDLFRRAFTREMTLNWATP